MERLDSGGPDGHPRVAVIIPNRDGADRLPACLDGLLAQTWPPDRVILVDDHSLDASRRIAARHPLPVEWLEHTGRSGFPGAVNAGLEAVLPTPADLIALLNNDAVPEPGWLEALVRAALECPHYQAFASRILTSDHPARIDSAGLALTRGFGQLSIGGGVLDGPAFAGRREVLGACGAAALYRKSVFTTIGLFDDELTMYWEDYDIALRGLAANQRTLYVGEARVRHERGATLGRGSWRASFYYHRNWLPVVLKSHAGLALRRPHQLCLTTLRMLLLAARKGRLLSCLLGFLAAPLLLRPRRWRGVSRIRERSSTAHLEALLDQGSLLRQEARAASRDLR
ncbi:MAG: glycosyltransferase family 2 protein [Planctomycetota bacterium]